MFHLCESVRNITIEKKINKQKLIKIKFNKKLKENSQPINTNQYKTGNTGTIFRTSYITQICLYL